MLFSTLPLRQLTRRGLTEIRGLSPVVLDVCDYNLPAGLIQVIRLFRRAPDNGLLIRR